MKRHLLCLTIDTDPDGLSGKTTNRQTLEWHGLEHLRSLPGQLESHVGLGAIPITWFIRADGQLESILGTPAFLLERFDGFWTAVSRTKHELAWHPHLYRQARREDAATLISDPNEALEEIERLWDKLSPVFPATSFRNGEGWHTPATYSAVEKMGFRCDSTAIPGRRGTNGHPMDWEGAPNRPYFPERSNLCRPGRERRMLELPMNTWLSRAPYDDAPKLRYMNPAVRQEIFSAALELWLNTEKDSSNELCVWVMIFHPDEVLPASGQDVLYSRSIRSLLANLVTFQDALLRAESTVEWVTVAKAGDLWRQSGIRHVA